MTTALVTGGAGFIGSHTVDLLVEKGYDVRVLDVLQRRVHPAGRPAWLPCGIDFQQGDVSDRDDLSSALEGVDVVLHLAAHQDHQPEFSRFMHTNTESTALLFELALADRRRYPVRKIVIASSQAACGEGKYRCPAEETIFWPKPRTVEQLRGGQWEHLCPSCGTPADPLPMDEETCSDPHTVYGISKLAGEMLAFKLGQRYGIATAAMRYTHVQGPRNSIHNAYSGIARRTVLSLMAGIAPTIYEDGGQLCDFVSVYDVARANVVALESLEADATAYNVGGPQSVSVLEFAEKMCAAYGSDVHPTASGRFRVGDPRHMVSDTTRLRSLGWEPKVRIEENITEYLEWLPSQTIDLRQFSDAEAALAAEGVVRDVG